MTRGPGVKSEAIRELLEQEPGISAADAIAKLAERGLEIVASQFYSVRLKASANGEAAHHKPAAPKVVVQEQKDLRMADLDSALQFVKGAQGSIAMARSSLEAVRPFVEAVGGMANALRLLDYLEQIKKGLR